MYWIDIRRYLITLPMVSDFHCLQVPISRPSPRQTSKLTCQILLPVMKLEVYRGPETSIHPRLSLHRPSLLATPYNSPLDVRLKKVVNSVAPSFIMDPPEQIANAALRPEEINQLAPGLL